jgi:glycosyltransferase involved in cell wall biosynthesis
MASADLRVLFVQGAGVRAGAERALLARLRHLPEKGIEPTVAFLVDGPFRLEVARTGVETVLLGPAPRLRSPTLLPGVVAELAALARSRDTAVMEGCGEKMSLLAGWAARLAGCRTMYNLQDAPRRDTRATLTQLAAASGRHDAVVVPSRWMADAFGRLPGMRATVIPNALVLEDLPDRPADVRAIAGWPRDALVVGLFGRLVAWKGADVFLKAARALAGTHPDVRFLVCGGTLYGEEPRFSDRLLGLARDLEVHDRVRFVGHREDALELIAGCDLICHCSLEPEPFGMVVLEAMALGKPVIASRAGGPEEMIEHGRTGILLDPGDPGRLATEIAGLADDPVRSGTLAGEAQAVARRDYGSLGAAEALSSLYRDVAAKGSP